MYVRVDIKHLAMNTIGKHNREAVTMYCRVMRNKADNIIRNVFKLEIYSFLFC